MKNKDSLYGDIRITQQEYSFHQYRDRDEVILRRTDRSTGANKEIRIERCDIVFIRLYYNLIYIGGIAYSKNWSYAKKAKPDSVVQRYTDYKNMSWGGHIYLARLLASGKADAYDLFQIPGKEITDPHPSLWAIPVYKPLFGSIPLLVVADEKVERVPSRFTFHLRRSPFLLRFINKRYNTHLQVADFDFNMDMFTYIAATG